MTTHEIGLMKKQRLSNAMQKCLLTATPKSRSDLLTFKTLRILVIFYGARHSFIYFIFFLVLCGTNFDLKDAVDFENIANFELF